ncbi:MAG: hypothetical protein OEX02_01705 [Cyclobacteriaceae bacterium]|nr:hypothetical protein [Cyclobacteriaceae bacterium]
MESETNYLERKVVSLFFLLVFFTLVPVSMMAQEGDYYVNNFVISPDRIDNPYFYVEQSPDGLIYVANRSGVLQYDGHRWMRISCPGAVYTLSVQEEGFYVGGKFGFGQIIRGQRQSLFFQSLSDSLDQTGNIFALKQQEGLAYFMNSRQLFVLNTKNNQIITSLPADSLEYENMFTYDGKVLAKMANGLFQQVAGSGLVEFNPGPSWPADIRLIEEDKGSNNTIVVSQQDEIFLNHGQGFKSLMVEDKGYFRDNGIMSVKWVNDSLIAVGTLKGGVGFVDIQSGKLGQIINSHTGLSDNETLGMLMDLDQGLWVAQKNGLDRIAPFLPISNFTHYPGLNGKLKAIYPFNDQLYISTSMGVYKLQEVKDFKEIVKLIRFSDGQSPKPYTAEQHPAVEEKPGKPDTLKAKERKGLFGFRRRKKEKEETRSEHAGFFSRLFKSKKTLETDSIYVEHKIFRQLQAIRYVFERVKGIESRSSFFREYNGLLFSGGLDGVYQLDGDTAIAITHEPVRDLLYTTGGYLVVSTVNREVVFYQHAQDHWEKVDEYTDSDDAIYGLIEDEEGDFWLSGVDKISRLRWEGDSLMMDAFDYDNPYSDLTYGVRFKNSVLFVNPLGYFFFNKANQALEKDTLLIKEIGLPLKYIYGGNDILWIYNGSRWYNISSDGSVNDELMLNLISDIKYVSLDRDENVFWVVSANDELFRVNRSSQAFSSHYKLFLKEVRGQSGLLNPEGTIRIEQINNGVVFEFIQPDYSGVLGIEYRYKLIGLEEEWSEWSAENVMRFPYLPPGDYRIRVETRDIFGQLNQSPEMKFRVVPPYWQRPWFYALEIGFFTLLLILSIRLNRSSNKKYLMLNRLLAFLTLILLVEFVQSIAESELETRTSPVIDFFIQVSIAAAILPLEKLLRRWLTGTWGGSKLPPLVKVLMRKTKKKE